MVEQLTPPGTPDIPVPDFRSQGQQFSNGLRESGALGWLLSQLGPAFWGAFAWLVNFIAESFDTVMAIWMLVMTKAQGINNPAFFTLTAETVSDLLGIEVSAEHVQQSFRRGGLMAGMEAVGDSFINQLVAEFATGGPLTPEGGKKAASAFMGFLISFSMREANLEFISTLIPENIRFGEDFRRYAVDMAQNVGLGRLARRVMQAPIQALITTPLTWYYNSKYRPTLFPLGEMFRSFTRGFIDEQTLDQQIAYHGIPDAWKNPLIQEYQRVPYQTEFFRSYQFGALTEEQVLAAYKSLGYSPEISKLLFDYTRFTDANTTVSAMISEIRSLVKSGLIEWTTGQDLLKTLPITDIRQAWEANLLNLYRSHRRKKVSLGEMEQAYDQGYVTLDDLQEFLREEGYSDNDRYILTLLALHKKGVEKEKTAIAQYKYNLAVLKAKKKGEPPPPPPILLQP